MSDVLDRLGALLGDRLRTDEPTRDAYRRDRWVLGELRAHEGRGAGRPRAVAEPGSTEEVAAVLKACRSAGVPVVTYGGGSGVCGGIQTGAGQLVLSTRRLSGLVALDERDLTATFRAGTNTQEAEERVAERGFTTGHYPQSIELATVGGFVATRSAGQFSTGYGNVEDVLLDLEVVLPDGGILRTRRTPRAAAGPDLRQLFLGSEGTLGVITEVTFSLRPKPPARQGQSFHFAGMGAGLDAIRRVVQAGWRPPVVRLYDAPESGRGFGDHCPPERALLLLVHEGPEPAVAAEASAVAALCEGEGGVAAGAAPVDHWLGHRNQVPGWAPFLEKGIILDTIEVAATWSRVLGLYQAAVASLRELPDVFTASAHSSHSYRAGTNLYFTFAARPEDPARREALYWEAWNRVMAATVAAGGGVAHHHGIGRVRRGSLADELGATGVGLLRAVKRAVDPNDLLNPGVLLPDR